MILSKTTSVNISQSLASWYICQRFQKSSVWILHPHPYCYMQYVNYMLIFRMKGDRDGELLVRQQWSAHSPLSKNDDWFKIRIKVILYYLRMSIYMLINVLIKLIIYVIFWDTYSKRSILLKCYCLVIKLLMQVTSMHLLHWCTLYIATTI